MVSLGAESYLVSKKSLEEVTLPSIALLLAPAFPASTLKRYSFLFFNLFFFELICSASISSSVSAGYVSI